MAKKTNLKAEKAKRNKEYALMFKKRKKPARRPAAAPSAVFTGTAPAPGPRHDGHPAVCSACGTDTTLPFKPVQGKPVFCRPCFDKVG